eukprot:4272697-Prymnesium_polylepis.1
MGTDIFRECFASTRDIPDGSGVFRVVLVSKGGVEKKAKRVLDEMISHCVKYGSCLGLSAFAMPRGRAPSYPYCGRAIPRLTT